MKLLWVVLLMVGTALGQSCPIKIESAAANHSQGHPPHKFFVKWKNVSDKQIVGEKFHVTFYNPTNDPQDVYEDWTADSRVKPNGTGRALWLDEYYYREIGLHARVWLVKVLFADGSTWDDDGSQSCSMLTPGTHLN